MERIQEKPELETLRNIAIEKPNIEEIVERLKNASRKLHAGFLFDAEGIQVLQKLCLLLCSTTPTNQCMGWEDFGLFLGISPLVLKSIKYNFQQEGPAYNTFLAYVQAENATLDKVIESLYKIKRLDIITQIEELFMQMCETIFSKHEINNNTMCIISSIVLDCPFIFKDITKLTGTKISNNIAEFEQSQTASPTNLQISKSKPDYTKIVLVTYAEDANDMVKDIVKQMRKVIDTSRLGVLILNEQRKIVNANPEKFIIESILQVDYVVPIITRQYLNAIVKDDVNQFSAVGNIDNKYVKFIYTLMHTQFVRSGCNNTKVRCLIYDEFMKNYFRNPVTESPLFQIWLRTSEVEQLTMKLLKGEL